MMNPRTDPDELRRQLDRMAASMFLEVEPFVALNDAPIHAARSVLERMGIDPDCENARTLLAPVEQAGIQRMLKSQTLSVRSAALPQRKKKKKGWDGY